MPGTELQEIREILRELSISQKETDAKFKETDAKFRETDKQITRTTVEMEKLSKSTDKRINKAFNLFESQWGKLMESLVEGDLVNILRGKGIQVMRTSTRVKGVRDGHNYEFDIIAHNGNEIVVVEVKTTLRVKHVKQFISQLKQIKEWIPEYQLYKVYGAIAYLREQDDAAKYAEKKRLFVIRATGDSADITNADDFVPKAW